MTRKKETKKKLPKPDNPNHKQDFLKVLDVAINSKQPVASK